MAMINLGSSMRYGPTGKRRKTKAWTTRTKKPSVNDGTLQPSFHEQARMEEAKKHREMYPSWTGTSIHTPGKQDDSYKHEVSKNYTVAIGYNKGAYQVIPNNEIKSIGK